MSQRGKTTVRGHALQFEGQALVPYDDPEPPPWAPVYRLTHHSEGVAYCECGAASPTLPSTAARQRWHRDVHKPAVREQNAEAEERERADQAMIDAGILSCPACGKVGLTKGGCLCCGAFAEAIARLEPGPWDDWGD